MANMISPKFSSVAAQPNPDGSIPRNSGIPARTPSPRVASPRVASPNATSPVPRASVSPTGSQTRSIMIDSGTSGAVVNNTPDTGLKRVPAVTFSETNIKPSQSQIGISDVAIDAVQTETAPSQVDDSVPVKKVDSRSSLGAMRKKLNSINTKVPFDHDAPLTISSPSSIMSSSENNIHSNLMLNFVDAKPTSNATGAPVSKEHPHFFVEDPLHTPAVSHSGRSRSCSNSSAHSGHVTIGALGAKTLGSLCNDPNVGKSLESVTEEHTRTQPQAQGQAQTQNPPTSVPVSRSSSTSAPGTKAVAEGSNGSNATAPLALNIPKRETGKNVDPRLPQDDGKLHVLFGATGSLSVFKIKPMIKKLEEIYGKDKIVVQVILTESATKFFTQRYMKKINKRNRAQVMLNAAGETVVAPGGELPLRQASECTEEPATPATPVPNANPSGSGAAVFQQIELPAHIQIWRDQDEWDAWTQRTDPVLHIELRRWADILVVAPLTANTLSKIALGLCDNLLTSVVRAWNPSFPIFLAPSMVSSIYNSVMTRKQLGVIRDEMPWITVFQPSEKVMGINGAIGLGGMMDANEIVDKIVVKLGGYPADDTASEEDEDEDEDEDEEEDENENKATDEDDDDDDDDEQ